MVNNDNKLVAQEYHAQKPDFEKGKQDWVNCNLIYHCLANLWPVTRTF